jgi:dsDNA-binding SOS-regulon protein
MKTTLTPLMAGLMLLALALGSGCNKAGSGSSASSSGSDDSSHGSLESRVDQHGDEVMASTTKAEARAWMKQPKHVFFKADARQVAKFVEDFYSAGATQVLVCDIEEEEGNQYGEALLVVLPKDKDARTKIFEVGSRADAAYQNDPTTDKGQKYLYYSLD